MKMDWQVFFKALVQTEETMLPIFVHNPQSQQITGAIMVTETIFGQLLGSLAVPVTPAKKV